MRQRFEVSQFLQTIALAGGLLVSTALCGGCSSTGQFAPHQAFKQATVPAGYQNYAGYAQPGIGQAQYGAAYGQQSQYPPTQFYGQNRYLAQPAFPSPYVTGGQTRGIGNNSFGGRC